MADINDLDHAVDQLKARWKAAHNHFASFGKTLHELEQQFATTDYGSDADGMPWTFERWLLRKCGFFKDQVFQRVKLFGLMMAADDREWMEAELRQSANKKRAERQQQQLAREQRQQERDAQREAEALLKSIEEQEKQVAVEKKPERRPRQDRRREQINEKGIPAVVDAFLKDRLKIATIHRIVGGDGPANSPERQAELLQYELARARPAELQPQRQQKQESVKPLNRKIKELLAQVRKTAPIAEMAMRMTDPSARREYVRAYGAALAALRSEIKSNNVFNALLKAEKLDLRNAQFRSDAMWLAENWNTLNLTDCPHTDPGHIRRWFRLRHMPKTETSEVIDFPRKTGGTL